MFRKSLAAAFAAAALAGLMTSAVTAQAEVQPSAPLQSVMPATTTSRSAAMLQPGGPALPAALAGKLLTRDGWAPIAAGQDGASSQMVVLRKKDTDLVRLIEVANGTLKVTAEGTATAFKKPAGPFSTASFDNTTMLPVPTAGKPGLVTQASGADSACFNDVAAAKNKLASEDGEGSVMKIATATGTLEITTGLNSRNTWTVIETRNGQSQTCMINAGVGFRVSSNYPQAHWAPAPAVPAPATEQSGPATSKLIVPTPATAKAAVVPNL